MKDITKKQLYILAAIFITVNACLINYYFFIIKPVQDSLNKASVQLRQEEALLSTVEAILNNKQETAVQGTIELQKRLPVDPLLEQFLLDLEKAETISGSFITSMSFGEHRTEWTADFVDEYIAAQTEEEVEEETVENTEEQTNEMLPSGIERLTIKLTVEAPSYFELEAFLQAIEDTRRITKIDELSFSGNEELVISGNEPDRLVYTLTVSTFYYPKLTELKNQLPPMEVPDPGRKINPLVPLIPDDDRNEDTEEVAETIGTFNQAEMDIIEHKVQPGETLFRISQKYYSDRNGEEIIKKANDLNGNTVYTGQVLKIPLEKK